LSRILKKGGETEPPDIYSSKKKDETKAKCRHPPKLAGRREKLSGGDVRLLPAPCRSLRGGGVSIRAGMGTHQPKKKKGKKKERQSWRLPRGFNRKGDRDRVEIDWTLKKKQKDHGRRPNC